MHRLAFLGLREGKHLHLRELMHAVEAAGGLAVGPGLGAEAVADAADLERQFVGLEDPLVKRAAERDLGRGDEREVGAGDRVDLRLVATRHEARALEDRVAGEIGRGHHREAFPHQEVDRVALQGQFQQHRVVHQKVEAVAGDAGARLEVEEFQPLADRDVVAGWKRKRGRRCLPAFDFDRGVLAADRRRRVREIGDLPEDVVRLCRDLLEAAFDRPHLLAEPAAFSLAGLPLGRIGSLGNRFAHLPGLVVEPVDVGLEVAPELVELGEPGHVGGRAAVAAVGGDEVDVVGDVAAVEHGAILRGER